jgi:hypothetical protein
MVAKHSGVDIELVEGIHHVAAPSHLALQARRERISGEEDDGLGGGEGLEDGVEARGATHRLQPPAGGQVVDICEVQQGDGALCSHGRVEVTKWPG